MTSDTTTTAGARTQLTCKELIADLKDGSPVRLSHRTGKVSHGYCVTRDYYFHTPEMAREFAASMGFESFNLYGWDGRNWSTGALN